jgi:Protein of unknown function (DUF3592)
MDINDLAWIIPIAVFGLIALIFAVVFGSIFRRWRTKQRVLQTGVDARATIVQIRDTGTRINDNPVVGLMLQVQPLNAPSFQVEVKETVSIVQLPMFQPGAQLQIKYDPAQPSHVAIVSVIGGPGASGPANSVLNAQQAEQMLTLFIKGNEQLLKSGVSAPAKVLQYMPMGINVNGNNPAVNFILEVYPTNGAAFTAQSQGNLIREANVPKYQPGQMVTVRYNPDDLTKVVVERSGG